ncbi:MULTISPECIES: AAA family ATPase [Metallosphaera]|uniref:AAA family ATPase n=1 Tax=Metallosphaera TaxID=41980 RepID=UPI001EDE4E70|nr:AAA family ATPase [Metallosphaera javensis (ex Hofmann et al. 2022)]
MKIEIKDLGPIISAELELRDSVVIVGPNASGKTTLSSAFYFLIDPFFINLFPVPGSKLEAKLDADVDLEGEVELDVRHIVELNKEEVVKTLEANIKRILDERSFGDVVKISSDKFRLVLGKDKDVEVKGSGKIKLKIDYVKGDHSSSAISFEGNIIRAIGNKERIRNEVASYAVSRYFQLDDWIPTLFLSTERIAFAQLLPLINYAVFSPLHPSPLKPLILDLLRYSITGEFDVFGHKVVFDDFPHKDLKVFKDSRDIGSSVATGVYQYSFVKAFLSYPWVKGLIVEEPEINLHVNAQIQVAREIANSHKRMFITTHSEWVAMVLAYLLRDRVRVYEIVNGKTEPRKVSEDGWLERLVTISPIQREVLEKMIEKSFG